MRRLDLCPRIWHNEFMEIGIIGLPQSGKTTLFKALSGGQKSISTFASGRLEVHTALTDVPDERLDDLERLFHPLKKTYAKVTYADIAGLEEGISQKGMPGPFINLLGQMDAFIHVVRAFENPSVPFSGGTLNPARDLSVLDMEFLLHDLGAVERRQERVDEGLKKGAQDKEQGLREKELLARVKNGLEDERPLRDLPLAPEEVKLLRGYGLLSLKPVLVVLNTGDDGQAPDLEYPHRNTARINLPGRLESEISELSAEDKLCSWRNTASKNFFETGSSASPMICSDSSHFLRWGRMRFGPGPSVRAPGPWRRLGPFIPIWPKDLSGLK